MSEIFPKHSRPVAPLLLEKMSQRQCVGELSLIYVGTIMLSKPIKVCRFGWCECVCSG